MRFATLILAVPLTIFAAAKVAGALEYEVINLERGNAGLVSGRFEYDTNPDDFERFIRTYGIGVITFYSPGGNPVSAMAIGRSIRKLGLTTFQLRQNECASACALAFLGGVTRYAEPGSIGIHKSSFSAGFSPDANTAASSMQSLLADTMEYLSEMGVSSDFLQLSLRYERDDMRYLSASEMSAFRVTTDNLSSLETDRPAEPPPLTARVAPPPPRVPEPAKSPTPDLSIPSVQAGYVRHPHGAAVLREGPGKDRAATWQLHNGTRVRIVGRVGEWYEVESDGARGYSHYASIRPDEFVQTPFEEKFIQVKSVRTLQEAREYIHSSPLNDEAYLSTNGWFAIALMQRVPTSGALAVLKQLKSTGAVPDDSIATYGNNYVRKVCCN